ncbi:hypothetical protein SDRG_05169 [Saprolegnia diclina VS20]|uniref:Uncharacterized protein n=1 Tax=Saprolegnia diclina (strain VS20) TaxID=1156394 RepID=T0S4F4_SAPDV|nr:hypothetical protein SDRG_05169 [Saprolegnia diclina VS20]EQC37572.1 hypothetical protein SDRG_05169 [Saprolegnia diclina VS20]|eukprot:XP_008609092.1 hypothetical protein SDRG_05169 [Saprolegnia diclina VS20]
MSTQRPWITVAHMVQTRDYRQCQSRWHRMLQQGIAVPQADAAIAHEVLATTIEPATTFERPESEEIDDLFRYWQSEDSIPGPAASDNSHVGAATDVASMFDPAMYSAPAANTPVETAEPLETTTTVVAHVAMSEDELTKWFSDTFLQELPMHV